MFNQPMKSHVHEALEIGSKRGVLTDEQRKELARMDLGYRGEMVFIIAWLMGYLTSQLHYLIYK